MTAHAHTEADATLADLKAKGWRIRIVPNSSGATVLEAWRRDKFMGEATTVRGEGATHEDAVRDLARGAG